MVVPMVRLKHWLLHGDGRKRWNTLDELERYLARYMAPGQARRTALLWLTKG